MHMLQSGQIAGFGMPCLFSKQICLIFECKNESANCVIYAWWTLMRFWHKVSLQFQTFKSTTLHMQGNFCFLPCILSIFLPVRFSNYFSIFFRRLSSLFFSFFFIVPSTFLSIKVLAIYWCWRSINNVVAIWQVKTATKNEELDVYIRTLPTINISFCQPMLE